MAEAAQLNSFSKQVNHQKDKKAWGLHSAFVYRSLCALVKTGDAYDYGH